MLQIDAKTRCLKYDLERPVQMPDGIRKQEAHVKVPFLGLVPIPSLLIDDVDVNFQMEVTDASTSKSEENADLSTDVTAKYQVRETVSQQQQAEGLSKLMDIMESCIEPLDKKE